MRYGKKNPAGSVKGKNMRCKEMKEVEVFLRYLVAAAVKCYWVFNSLTLWMPWTWLPCSSVHGVREYLDELPFPFMVELQNSFTKEFRLAYKQ